MHRFLFFSLALVCLLAGCSAPQASDPAPDESNDLDAYFEEEPADNEMGSAEFGLQDPMDTVYTYDGESLEIPFSITGASSGKTTEIGVLLFVDGVAQPYSAVYEDGTELEESYMQIFNLDYEQQENFDMVFQPVTGKAGETVPVMAVTILEPSFVAEGPDNPRYGFHHQESATTSRQISFATDAPTQTLAAAATDYNVVDLPQDILDTLAAWGATDSWTRRQPCPWVLKMGITFRQMEKQRQSPFSSTVDRRRISISLCLSTTSLSNSMERTISLCGL